VVEIKKEIGNTVTLGENIFKTVIAKISSGASDISPLVEADCETLLKDSKNLSSLYVFCHARELL
jgi:hypothetical protein